MSGLVLLVLACAGLGLAAHWGRNRLLAAALPGLVPRFEARLGGRVEPGRLALDPGYAVELAGTRLVRGGLEVTVARGRVEGLVGSLVLPGERPVRLVGFTGLVAAAGGAGVELGFDGSVVRRADDAVEVAGRLSHAGQAVELTLRVEPASRLDAPWIRLGAKGAGLRLPGAGEPALVADLDLALEALGEGEALHGRGALRLGAVQLPGLARLAGILADAGLPPLPPPPPFTARTELTLAPTGLTLRGLEVPAGPLAVTGTLSLGAAGALGGDLEVAVDAAWLAGAPGGVALRPAGRVLALAAELAGTRDAPAATLTLREPVGLEHAAGRLDLERAALRVAAPHPFPVLLGAAGVVRVPGPGGARWTLPLEATGAEPGPGEAARLELVLRGGFDQPPEGGPPRWPPLAAQASLGLTPGLGLAARVEVGPVGTLVPGGATVELTRAADAEGGAWRATLGTPARLEHAGMVLELARAEACGGPGLPPRLAAAAGVLGAPGPGTDRWLLPLAFEGTAPGPGEALAGTLRLREGFLRPGAGGAPVLPPLSAELRLGVAADGAASLRGPLSTAASTLHLALLRAPGGTLDGTRLHGRLAPRDLAPWIPGPVLALLFEDEPLTAELAVDGSPAVPRVRLEAYAPRLLRGTGALRARLTGLDPAALEGELELTRIRLERVPTSPAGAREVAPHLEASASGRLALGVRDGRPRIEGPVEFDEASLLFLEPLSKGAQGLGLPALDRRLAGPARARLECDGTRLVLRGLSLAAGPLSARGELALGGSPACVAGLDLEVATRWLARAPFPGKVAPGTEALALKLAVGREPSWGLALAAPVRLVAEGLVVDLAAARVADGVLERAEATVEVALPGGRSLVLPLGFLAAVPPGPGAAVEGTLTLEDGLVVEAGGTPSALPLLAFEGPLRVARDGAVALRGTLSTAGSRLAVEVRRSSDGELAGTRLAGPVALDELEPLLPPGLAVSAPDGQAPAVSLELEGPPADLGLNGTLHAPALRVAGDPASGLPPFLLGDLEADFALDRAAFELRRAGARFTGGRVEVSGSVAHAEAPPRYEVEVRLQGLRVERLATNPAGDRPLEGQLEGALSGELTLRGKGTGLRGLHGKGSLTLAEPRYLFLHRAGENAGVGPLPTQGRGPARAALRLVREELHVEGLEAAIRDAEVHGDLRITAAGRLEGKLEAALAGRLLAKSALLAFPAAAIDTLHVPVGVGGTLAHPRFDADVMAALERLLGRSTVGRTMKGAVDTLWAAFGPESVRPGPDLDRVLAKILKGGPDGDDCLERLIATGITPAEVQELLDDYRNRRDP